MRNNIKHYPATYHHNNQSHAIIIQNDGKQLSFELNGHYFYGTELSAMETDDVDLSIDLAFHHDSLCDCQFHYQITQILVDKENIHHDIILNIEHRLGKPAHHGGLDDETIIIKFDFQNQCYIAQGGWYEDVFMDLVQQLGQGFYFKNCLFCKYSDYAIWGQSAFASLMCFYSQKEDYFKVKRKFDYIPLYEHAGNVQETGLCDLFIRFEQKCNSNQ